MSFAMSQELEELVEEKTSSLVNRKIGDVSREELDKIFDSVFNSSEYRNVGLSKKELAFISIGYPKTSKYSKGKIEFTDLLELKARLVDVGNVRNKEHLIGKKKCLADWKHHFSDGQIYKLTFEK
jgi:hypothetical protein